VKARLGAPRRVGEKEAFFNILSGLFVELLFVHCYNAPHRCANIDS
jgi:hypothetical protein